jgi:hypothetical protein
MRLLISSFLCLASAAGLAHADCKADLAAVLDMHKTAGPYHASMTTTSAGRTTKAEADVILPDRFHVVSTDMEMIMVKKQAWMKMGGSWQAMPGEAASMMSGMIQSGMAKGISGASNITCLGAQSFQGSSYTGYAFDSTGSMMGIKATSHVTMYTADSGLPAWVVVDGKAMGKASKTVQKLIFKSSISIAPPQ